MASCPLRLSFAVTTVMICSSGRPVNSATKPTAIMFSRPPLIAFAISPIGHSTIVQLLSINTRGGSPAAGSAITNPPSATGIAFIKRSAFFQSNATRMSNSFDMQKAGCVDRRTSAAASPPRICGPTERFNSPCKPALPAASNRIDPAVIAPIPPEPTMANDTFFLGSTLVFILVPFAF